MYRLIGWAGLLLGTTVVLADEPVPVLPAPRVNTQPPQLVRPDALPIPMRQTPRPALKFDPEELQRATGRLRSEREALHSDRAKMDQQVEDASGAAQAEATRLRLRLGELLLQLNTARPATQTPPQGPPAPAPNGKTAVPPGKLPAEPGTPTQPPPAPEGVGQFVDPLALAQSLFRAGDYESALGTFRLLDLSALDIEQRVLVQYLMACSQRKLGKFEEAATLFREVANAKEDPVLADCAQWQLSALSWQRDLEAQLLQLRKRRQAVEGKP